MISILLVDDHATLRRAVRKLLERSGEVEVVGEVDDGQQALQAIDKLAPDIVVLDVLMPKLDGFGVLKALQKMPRRPKVLMLSMDDTIDARQRALAHGASAYVPKQFTHQQLLPAVKAVAAG